MKLWGSQTFNGGRKASQWLLCYVHVSWPRVPSVTITATVTPAQYLMKALENFWSQLSMADAHSIDGSPFFTGHIHSHTQTETLKSKESHTGSCLAVLLVTFHRMLHFPLNNNLDENLKIKRFPRKKKRYLEFTKLKKKKKIQDFSFISWKLEELAARHYLCGRSMWAPVLNRNPIRTVFLKETF